jgi:hypothetical protein
MRKIFLVALMALMLSFTMGMAQNDFDNKAIVILDDVLVGHAPSIMGEWRLPVSQFSIGAGVAYFEDGELGTEYGATFVPKISLVAGQEMFYGIIATYPTKEWVVEYGAGLQFPITEWGGLRIDYTWLQIKNPTEIEYNQDGLKGLLGVGFWADLF